MSSEHQYYSIILKGCSHLVNLGQRLENTLLRGRLAIKMALDNVPSVIIYKGNVTNIIPIYKAFKSEQAAITILLDGVPPALPVSKKYRDYSSISPELQSLLTHVPDKLWLGEAIHRIVPASFLDENGALVVSSHALYFIDKPAGDPECRWLIIPYGQISEISELNETSLLINHQDTTGGQNDLFTLPPEILVPVKDAIKQAKASERYLIKLKTFCPGCSQVSEDLIDCAPALTYCPNCGQPYQRTIIA
jgi:hypothetical protein